jgi:hypothetical protein
MEPFQQKKFEKVQEIYKCTQCNYNTCRFSQYERHIHTRKHKNQHLSTTPKIEYFECDCGKTYKERSGLWRHKKKCEHNIIKEDDSEKDDSEKDDSEKDDSEKKLFAIENAEENLDYKQMFLEMMKQNNEMQQTMRDIIPKLGSTTTNNNNTTNNYNKFNLNVFLNDHCKDALNIQDFVNSLQIQLQDLEVTKEDGLASSISNIILKRLNELDIHKRPIHCTDLKREIIYIKDEEKWVKDNEKAKMRASINDIANKQRLALSQWTDAHPKWMDDEKLKDEYVTLCNKLMQPLVEKEKEQNKIIKKVSNATIIDKE